LGAADFTSAFLAQSSQLESRLRELFLSINPQPVTDPLPKLAKTLHDKGKLGDADYQTFRALWRVRNLVIHGNQVPQGDLGASARVASTLGARLDSPPSVRGSQGGA
jgi:hypothetical protein